MFDIGFLELILVSIVGLLVLGPDRLPGAIRTVSLYVGKLRRSFNGIRAEIERELKADEIRQELHNQAIMQELRQTGEALRQGLEADDTKPGKDGNPLDEGDVSERSPSQQSAKPAGQEARAAGSAPEETDTSPAQTPVDPAKESLRP